MSHYLLLFTFGPVQGFISQARKTADLFAGSAILSELAQAVLGGVQSPHEVLSPSRTYHQSLTNRIVLRVEGNRETVKKLGKELTKAVNDQWDTIAREAIGEEYFLDEQVKKQLSNHLETYWVAVPEDKGYPTAYTALNRYAAADKNQRSWSVELNEDQPGRKCALDGTRNALFFKAGGKAKSRVVMGAIELEEADKSLQANEALSAVSYVKRKYGQKRPYPSTARIALLHILEGWGITMNFDSAKETDQLYFEENLTPSYFKKIGEKAEQLEEAKRAQQEWKKAVKAADLQATPYYALLHFDGDSMGKWFSGESLPPGMPLQDFHTDFTEKLGQFAQDATRYLDEPGQSRGRTVYAGGDDFVGFLNLNHLFEVLYALRAKFDSVVWEPLRCKYDLKEPITFSAGVAIAHYKQPLGMVLDQARRMEKRAKNWPGRPGKDACGLGLMIRAGATDEVVVPWKHEGLYTPSDIEEFVNHIRRQSLSTTFINNLSLTERHYGGWPQQPVFLADYRDFLFKRSINEKHRNKENLASKYLVQMLQSLENQPDEQQKLLNIIEFLSRHLSALPQ